MNLTMEGADSAPNVQGGVIRHQTTSRFLYHFTVNNTPTFLTYAFGTILILYFNVALAVIFAAYCVLSTFFLWRFVCTHCPHCGNSCNCGFGVVAQRLFRKRDESVVRSRMKLLAGLVFPIWVIPPIIGAYLLVLDFSGFVMIVLVIFLAVAFVIAPVVSRIVSCCDIWRYSIFARPER